MLTRSSVKRLQQWMLVFLEQYPRCFLLLWLLPLLLLQSQQQSFMAHDEGIYAGQARAIVENGNWLRPNNYSYDRTVGIQWLIAISFQVFGLNEWAARFPSLLACLLGVVLTYEIGRILLNQHLALIGALILSVTPLWIQYGRLATQDMVLVCLELIAIWALLQAELLPAKRFYWGFLAGAMFGLGFLIKGFMVIAVAIALGPYLLMGQRQHRHLLNPGLYLGLVIGMLPVVIWLGLSVNQYGDVPLQALFGKFLSLSRKNHTDHGLLFYVWNIPANAFPWVFFALGGLILVLRQPALYQSELSKRSLWLFIGYPLVLLIELTIFKTRTRYYALQLLPFLALLAAICLDWLKCYFQQSFQHPVAKHRWLLAILSYGVGLLAGLLVLAGLVSNLPSLNLESLQNKIALYGLIAIGLGLGWLLLPISFAWGQQQSRRGSASIDRAAKSWMSGWLLGPWLGLAMFGLTGIWGDYNPDLKTFLVQPQIAQILQAHPVHRVRPFVKIETYYGKTNLLLDFYIPQPGQVFEQVSELQPLDYAFLAPPITTTNLQSPYQEVGSVRGWRLIQILDR